MHLSFLQACRDRPSDPAPVPFPEFIHRSAMAGPAGNEYEGLLQDELARRVVSVLPWSSSASAALIPIARARLSTR